MAVPFTRGGRSCWVDDVAARSGPRLVGAAYCGGGYWSVIGLTDEMPVRRELLSVNLPGRSPRIDRDPRL